MAARIRMEESVLMNPAVRRHSRKDLPPLMSELRIVLLGENSSEISRVGNFILGRDAFDTEAPSPSVELYSERARGTVEGRYITLITTPHLLDPQLSEDQIRVRFKECLYLCAPGPHIFFLVLQSGALKKENQDRIRCVLEDQWFMKYTVVLTPDEGAGAADSQRDSSWPSHLVISKTKEGHKVQVPQLLEKIDEVVKHNEGGYLTCDANEALKPLKAEDEKKKFKRLKTLSLKHHKHVRIVLLGKNSSENNSVGNFILGRDAFDTEAPPPSVEQHSERARGRVEGIYITLINTPNLFDPSLSLDQITLQITESMILCAPGPHVFLLVLQPEECTQRNWDRMKMVLNLFSDSTLKHTTVLTTQKQGSSLDPRKENPVVEEIVKQCGGRRYQFETVSIRSDLLKVIDKMVKKNKEYMKNTKREESPQERKNSADVPKEVTRGVIHLKPSMATGTKAMSERLNLVLCGSNRVLKSSISDLILGQIEHSPESSSVCVRREGEVCGRLITLVEMPALYNTQLSEEEVMRETFHCVSLCDPGVHAFLLVIPEGHFTDEDRGEIEKIQKVFGSRFNDHTVVLINQQNGQLDEAAHAVMKDFGERHLFFSCSLQVQDLIEKVENRETHYTTETYLSAHFKLQQKYEREVAGLKQQMCELTMKNSPKTLRIILLGKTGTGKSATGNTILGRDVFQECIYGDSVTKVCHKESVELSGRQISVIDTPGLFNASSSDIDTGNEITKSIAMAAPGPHAFLLVVPIGRFNQDMKETLMTIQHMFGDHSKTYTMVLFTRGDDLGKNTIEQFIENSGQNTKDLIRSCGNRYHVFNNRNPEERAQVTALLEKIDCMVSVNGGSFYTNEMFHQVEKGLQQERILKEREEEIEREKEELRAKEDKEMEMMMENVEKQREQQLLWYQKLMKKRSEQQEHSEV